MLLVLVPSVLVVLGFVGPLAVVGVGVLLALEELVEQPTTVGKPVTATPCDAHRSRIKDIEARWSLSSHTPARQHPILSGKLLLEQLQIISELLQPLSLPRRYCWRQGCFASNH